MSNFLDVFEDVTKKGTKIPTEKYLKSGKYPIIDQGQSYISGYCNDETGLFDDIPVIIFGDHTRIIKYVDQPCFLGADGVKLLKSKDRQANYKYLYYALCSAKIPDTGYNRHFKWLKELEIPLPPLEIQKQIADTLDKVTHTIDTCNAILKKLDLLVKSRFVEMFGTLETPVSGFEYDTLKNLCRKITDGKHGGCSFEEGTSFYFVGAREIYDDSVHYDTAPEITAEDFYKDYKRCNIEKGDFLIVNTGATIGKSAIATDDRTEHTLLQKSVALMKAKKEKLLPIFLMYCYKVNDRVYRVESASAQPNLLLSKINATKIYVPPLTLQQQFATFVEQTDKTKQQVKMVLEKAETLKKALMQEYFG